jgi:hypothetical protein
MADYEHSTTAGTIATLARAQADLGGAGPAPLSQPSGRRS